MIDTHMRETRDAAKAVSVQPSNPYAYNSESFKRFEAALECARLEVMDLLAAASMESYVRAYPLMLPLHYLAELRHGWDILHEAFAHRGRTSKLLGDKPNESMTHFVSASQGMCCVVLCCVVSCCVFCALLCYALL
jgi:hypothetical protein